jgi:hypothetical protein
MSVDVFPGMTDSTIVIQCAASKGIINKVVRLAYASILNPSFEQYKIGIQLSGEKPDKGAFTYEVDKIRKAVKQSGVCISGKTSESMLTSEKLNSIVDSLPVKAMGDKKEKRDIKSEHEIIHTMMKASTPSLALFVMLYLKSNKVNAFVSDKVVMCSNLINITKYNSKTKTEKYIKNLPDKSMTQEYIRYLLCKYGTPYQSITGSIEVPSASAIASAIKE